MHRQVKTFCGHFALFALVVLCAMLAVLPTHNAAAAELGDSYDITEITPFEALNYYIARHFNAYSVAVTGFLNPEVELPAKVEIAIPTGSEILWFSEISGGFIGNDPEFRTF